MQRLVLVSLAAVAAVSVLATAPSSLSGQGPSSTVGSATAPVAKIAFISSQEILRKTPGYAVAESTYRKELAASQTEVQKLQQQLDSAVQALDQAAIALSPAARQAKQKDLQAMQQRMEQRGNELQGIRAEMNYSLILDADAGGGFIAALDPALNITPRVLQRLSQAQ